MFIVALFTIAKTQKQPKYLSTDEWVNKMWVYIYMYTHTHTHIGILVIKRKSCDSGQHG